MRIARGSHYQNPWVYKFFTALKLRDQYHLRYRIAAQYIEPGESVLDVCAGYGEFKNFLPAACSYQAIEASPSFAKELSRQRIPYQRLNLHEGIDATITRVDVVTMIISLCQFQNTAVHQLLENFKQIAKKVVIVEDVLAHPKMTGRYVEKIRDYLCATDYYLPMRLFSADEFQSLMQQHDYRCQPYNERYWVGCYGGGEK